MSKFKAGDKVKLVDTQGIGKLTALKLGDVCTVGKTHTKFGTNYVFLVEDNSHGDLGYFEDRFELVNTTSEVRKFKAGDKVKCIDGAGKLQLGSVYTFSKFDDKYSDMIILEEFGESHGGYFESRFELVKDEPKFEVGQWVKIKAGRSLASIQKNGQIGQIAELSEYYAVLNDGYGYWLNELVPGPTMPKFETTQEKSSMKVMNTELLVTFDVDQTLIMHDGDNRNLAVIDPHDGSKRMFRPHAEHVKLLKDHKTRGYTVVVWSAAGAKWAEAAVISLKLENYVDFCMPKPLKYVDDLEANQILVNRVYITEGK